jgi:hypothetical protein
MQCLIVIVAKQLEQSLNAAFDSMALKASCAVEKQEVGAHKVWSE